ncbi:hypothetical protein GMRT_15201 [Giardia muris]|uniref:Uncharacterized protein n=1 Tax=Giardia muris TaxID=5742 RepID=A0A4Z1T4X5_GIAMU|nr:hypothetical protein GMRT_15201 [Giardia muris]|eukprot:TNJ28137.1 hypothetical protein GMRT_15201 [Giardia muris]
MDSDFDVFDGDFAELLGPTEGATMDLLNYMENNVTDDAQPTLNLPSAALIQQEVASLRAENVSLQEQVQMLRQSLMQGSAIQNALEAENAHLKNTVEVLTGECELYRQECERLQKGSNTRDGELLPILEVMLGIPGDSLTPKVLEDALQLLLDATQEQAPAPPPSQPQVPPELLLQLDQFTRQISQAEARSRALQEEVASLKIQLDRSKSTYQSNVIFLRKRYEQVTGWRLNMQTPYNFSFELRAGPSPAEIFSFVCDDQHGVTLLPQQFLQANPDIIDACKQRQAEVGAPAVLYPQLMALTLLRRQGLC